MKFFAAKVEFSTLQQSSSVIIGLLIGALVTSPDIITQIAVAIPVVLLYEVGYRVVKHVLRR